LEALTIGEPRRVAEARKTERPISSLSGRSAASLAKTCGRGIEEGSPSAIGHRPRAGDETLDAQRRGSPARTDDRMAEPPDRDLPLAGTRHYGIIDAQCRNPSRGAGFSRKELGWPATGTGERKKTAQGQNGGNGALETADPIFELDRPIAQRTLDDVEPDLAQVMTDPPTR
jgi:hypothetical protein